MVTWRLFKLFLPRPSLNNFGPDQVYSGNEDKWGAGQHKPAISESNVIIPSNKSSTDDKDWVH